MEIKFKILKSPILCPFILFYFNHSETCSPSFFKKKKLILNFAIVDLLRRARDSCVPARRSPADLVGSSLAESGFLVRDNAQVM